MRSTEEHSPVTLGERYSGAIESANLLMREGRGDVDLIIAAGIAEDRMASALFRLMVEYSNVRADHVAAESRMRNQEREAREQEDEGKASLIREEAERAALTAHVMILAHLRTLREAKERLGKFAIAFATRKRFMRPDEVVIAITGRVLDVLIAPTCQKCGGPGVTGSARRGEVVQECRPCKGSGSRRESIGQSDAERLFARDLFGAIDVAMSKAQRAIGMQLAAVTLAKVQIADAARGELVRT